ncbi:TPA: hypothetical protein QDZ34_000920 [Stenotrophomonas maltophilia]|nr:hypothetical protein [Stenotrophomonas maltophilia]HDS1024652.1 hypothetical protein [Stenotrophomonas maltophilia]HDS1029036.1 hypothetical protein [Stenotrophomonas maltophilia]HDS1033604.1 hypothetical protein [Stenotrophomonas maltophilia]
MRTDLWDQFGDLIGGSPRLLATVTAHNSDGTSTLTTYDGVQMRAFGQLPQTVPYNVWVRGGRLVEPAPNLPLYEVSI